MIEPSAVRTKMAAFLKVPPERLTEEAELSGLVHESFVLVQLVVELQEEFNVRLLQEDLKTVRTVGDLVATVVAHEKT